MSQLMSGCIAKCFAGFELVTGPVHMRLIALAWPDRFDVAAPYSPLNPRLKKGKTLDPKKIKMEMTKRQKIGPPKR